MRRVVDRLRAAGYQAYPVGGCVRDLLLGRPVTDWDLTTDARPGQVSELFDKVIPTGIDHGTVTVMVGQVPIEVTTFRGEDRYSDGRHPDQVVFLDSLEEDLKRRDFTINAMALDLEGARIVDPHAGQGDLQRALVRAVGDPDLRFHEDGLRPMRAIRFAAVLGFEVEPATLDAIGRAVDVLRNVSMERIREELLKILGSRNPALGIELLASTGLLDHVLPGLLAGRGFAQNRFHRLDVYQHALRCLDKSRGDAVLRLAILLHDIGKPATAAGPPAERTFYGHEQESARQADALLRRLCFSNRDRQRVTNLIHNHMFHYQPDWSDGAVRRLVARVGLENLPDLWELRRSDAWGRGPGLRSALANLKAVQERIGQVLTQDAALKVTDLAIGGAEVMRQLGCPPGPAVGRALSYLLDRVLDEPGLNQPEKLKNLLATWSE